MTAEILHLQLIQMGNFRVATGANTWQENLDAWLWTAPETPPPGVTVDLERVMISGYNLFVVSNLYEADLIHLTPHALEWVVQASATEYEPPAQVAADEAAESAEHRAGVVPHLNGVTYGQIEDDLASWLGLHEYDGYFTWVGDDSYHGGTVLQQYPIDTINPQFNANVRWWIEDQHMTLRDAAQRELQERWDAMALAVVFMGH